MYVTYTYTLHKLIGLGVCNVNPIFMSVNTYFTKFNVNFAGGFAKVR